MEDGSFVGWYDLEIDWNFIDSSSHCSTTDKAYVWKKRLSGQGNFLISTIRNINSNLLQPHFIIPHAFPLAIYSHKEGPYPVKYELLNRRHFWEGIIHWTDFKKKSSHPIINVCMYVYAGRWVNRSLIPSFVRRCWSTKQIDFLIDVIWPKIMFLFYFIIFFLFCCWTYSVGVVHIFGPNLFYLKLNLANP